MKLSTISKFLFISAVVLSINAPALSRDVNAAYMPRSTGGTLQEILQTNDKLNQLSSEGSLTGESLAEALRARKNMLLAVLKENPDILLSSGLSKNIIDNIPPSLHNELEQPATVSGELEIHHTDTFDQNISEFEYVLAADNGKKLNIYFAGEPSPELVTGAELALSGVQLDDSIVVPMSGVQIAAQVMETGEADPYAPIVRKLAVIIFRFKDQGEAFTPGQARNTIFTGTQSVRSYYNEATYGRLSLEGALDPVNGDVFGWYVLPYNKSECNLIDQYSLAMEAAAADGFVASNYTNILTLDAGWSGCGQGNARGGAVVGGTFAWVHYLDKSAIAHELGHNFELMHANALRCKNESGTAIPFGTSAQCSNIEYGDPFDVMGIASMHHFSAIHKQFGYGNWLPPANIARAYSEGLYTIRPQEPRLSGTQLLYVGESSMSSLEVFNLEFRQPYGIWDNFSPTSPVAKGISIRRGSQLLDMVTSTASFGDASLTVGKTFTDPLSGLTIKTISVSPSGAVAEIKFGPCVRNAPQIQVVPNVGATHDISVPVTYKVQVTNFDSVNCGSSEFEIVPTLPVGWTQMPANILETVQPGEVKSWNVDVLASASTQPGLNYPLKQRVTNLTSFASSSVNASFKLMPVTITSPINGAHISEPQTITVRAETSPSLAGARIEFFDSLNGGITTLIGSKTSVPYEVSLPLLDASQNGTHSLMAKISQSGAQAFATPVTITVGLGSDGNPATNTPPVVNMAASTTILIGDSLPLTAEVEDDGPPTGSLTYAWSLASSSSDGTATFADPTAKDTSATFSATGTFVLRLTVSDGELSAFADIEVTVFAVEVEPFVVTIDSPYKSAATVGNKTSGNLLLQSFKAEAPLINGVTLRLSRTGTGQLSPLVVALREDLTDSSGIASVTVSIPDLPTQVKNAVDVFIPFQSLIPLIQGNTYYLAISAETINASNYYNWVISSRDVYPDGKFYRGTTGYAKNDGIMSFHYGASQ